MRKTLLLLLALCVAGVAFGQGEKQKVAVWVSGTNADINMVISDQLVSAISLSNRYVAVERSADFLRMVQKEMGYQQNSGNVADGQIATWGKQMGVKLVCVAKVTPIAGTNHVSARIVNVETANVEGTPAIVSSKFESYTAIITTCETLASQLLGVKSGTEIARAKQAKEKGYAVIANTLYVQTSLSAEKVDYHTAAKACRASLAGGYSDWRLPTVDETKRIWLYNKDMNLIDLGSHVWTSTESNCPIAYNATSCHILSYVSGSTLSMDDKYDAGAGTLCVRGY